MKRFISMFCVFMVMIMAFSPVAEAKRMGGRGMGSMGRTYKTSPRPDFMKSNRATEQSRQNTETRAAMGSQQQKSSKWGMLGGALAGMAAGGLLASLLGGGSFSGMQGLDFIILGLLAFVIFFLFRKLRRNNMTPQRRSEAQSNEAPSPITSTLGISQPELKTSNGADYKNLQAEDSIVPAASSAGGIGEHDVPDNLPSGFDQQAFLEGAREHYFTLQKAWNENNLELIKEYMSEALFEHLREERGKLEGKQHTEVLFLDVAIVRGDYTSRVAQVSIKYTGRYKDAVEGVEEDISDIWHLERDITNSNAPWLIVGIE